MVITSVDRDDLRDGGAGHFAACIRAVRERSPATRVEVLVPDLDGRRCAAVEILINTPHISELILKGEIGEIKEAMQESGTRGMQTFDDALFALYKEGRISLDEALNNADSRTNLEAKINFG